MKNCLLLIGFCLVFILTGCSSPEFMLDSFEGDLNSKTVDFGASENSILKVLAAKDIKVCQEQALKLEYDLKPSGYMWAARGFGLDVKGAAAWLGEPEDIKWNKYNAISVYIYGEGKGGVVAFDIKDAGGEFWRYLLDDDSKGWKEVICPFKLFFARSDWQPDNADNNEVLDFPLMSFQFEPRLPGKGVYYFDCIKLIRVKK